MMQTILIVEDEKKLAHILSDYLKRDGFKTEMIDDGIEVVPWVKANKP